MPNPRKKWKLVLQPTLAEEKVSSENKACERVRDLRERFAAGTGRISVVTIKFDEGLASDGYGHWQTFERCDFRDGDWAVEPGTNPAP